jgi:hypothetical protein
MGRTVTLAEFALEYKRPGRVCWACGIPESAEINAARKAGGVSVPAMCKWLISKKGYTKDQATKAKLNYHFERDHHEPSK